MLDIPPLNMNLSDFSSFHIIGCGGAGCAPLTRLLHEKNLRVTGSDLIENGNTRMLRDLGIPVFTGQSADHLPHGGTPLIIRTSAAGTDNPERLAAERAGMTVIQRGQALALVASSYRRTVSICGSHGKTTVTSMIAWVLSHAGLNPGIMIGGNVPGWPVNGSAGNGDLFVTEADESDSTHALLKSALGIVTNVEDDHAWSVGGVEALENSFRTFASRSDTLFCGKSAVAERLFAGHPAVRFLDLENIPADIPSKFPHFMRMDMAFAVAAAEFCGIDHAEAIRILSDFPGVDRRLSFRHRGVIPVIEDYAHHPTELKESLRALRELCPGKRLTVIFQPHRYARLERYFDDFAKVLSTADRVFITPVFAAWTSGGKYSSEDLASAVRGTALRGTWDEMGHTVGVSLRSGDMAAIIGAGDLQKILPSLIAEAQKLDE